MIREGLPTIRQQPFLAASMSEWRLTIVRDGIECHGVYRLLDSGA